MMNARDVVFDAAERLLCLAFDYADLAEQPLNWIEVVVDDALFEWDDGVICDVYVFWTDFGAALRDVAEADACLAA